MSANVLNVNFRSAPQAQDPEGTILEFKQKPVVGQMPKFAQRPAYVCTKCEGDFFKLLNDGSVWCHCGTLIRNLRVRKTD